MNNVATTPMFCWNNQIFSDVDLQSLANYFLRIKNISEKRKPNRSRARNNFLARIKSGNEILKDYQIFGWDKYKRAYARLLAYKYWNFSDHNNFFYGIPRNEKEKIKKYCFLVSNKTDKEIMTDKTISKNLIEKIQKMENKMILYKSIYIVHWTNILKKTLWKIFEILEKYHRNNFHLDKKEINNLIFYFYVQLVELAHEIQNIGLVRKKKWNEDKWKEAINSIEKVINNYLTKLENSNPDIYSYMDNRDEIFHKMKTLIWEGSLNTIIIDYWEILAEYMRFAISYRNAILLSQMDYNPQGKIRWTNNNIINVIKFTLISEYLNENFLIDGANTLSWLSKDFLQQVELLESSSNFLYTLLLAFWWSKILGISTDMKLAIKWDDSIVWDYYLFFFPYLTRFIKYNVLNMFDLTAHQIDAISKIYNMYNIFNSKDSGAVMIENGVNRTISHLVERRNSSKLSSLIVNNFNFFKKNEHKTNNKVNFSFSDYLKEELDMDVEQIVEELSCDISWTRQSQETISMVFDDDRIKKIFLITKDIVFKGSDIINMLWIWYIFWDKEENKDKYVKIDTDYIYNIILSSKNKIKQKLNPIRIKLTAIKNNIEKLQEYNKDIDILSNCTVEEIEEILETDIKNISEEDIDEYITCLYKLILSILQIDTYSCTEIYKYIDSIIEKDNIDGIDKIKLEESICAFLFELKYRYVK